MMRSIVIDEDLHAELKSEAARLKLNLTEYVSEILDRRSEINIDG